MNLDLSTKQAFNIKTIIKYIMSILFILILTVFYIILSKHTPMNSDHASIILEAKDIFEGNILLKNWTLSTVSYYTTDIPFYVIAIALYGFSNQLLYIVPGVLYAITVFFALYLSSKSTQKTFSYISSLITFSLIGLPTLFLSENVLVGAIHIVAYLYIIVAFICIENFKSTEKKFFLFVYYLFLTLALVGDNITIFIAIIPVIIVSLINIYYKMDIAKNIFIIIGNMIVLAFSKIALSIIYSIGGFVVPGTEPLKYNGIKSLWNNIYITISGISEIFGIRLIRHNLISPYSFIDIVKIAGMSFVFYSLYKMLKKYKKCNFVDQVLLILCVSNLLGYTLTNLQQDISTTRYLIPFILFGSILCGRIFTDLVNNNKFLIISLCTIYFFASTYPITMIFQRQTNIPEKKLCEFLTDHDLTNGYGSFWCSSIITLLSREDVKIRSIVNINNDLQPFEWLSNKNWYMAYANFIVTDDSNWGNISSSIIVKTFGYPDYTYNIDKYTVFVWNKNITPLLKS